VNWASENTRNLGFCEQRLFVGGDSAGGNLAAIVCLHARDKSKPAIAAQMLIYPVLDHVNSYESTKLYSKGYMLDSMPYYTASYLPDAERRSDPMASPIFAKSLKDLPPVFMLTSGFDPLHDEDCAYVEKLRAAGVTVDQVNYPAMIHGFTLLRKLLPEADEALADAARRTLALAAS
jgi:acetyl esterase